MALKYFAYETRKRIEDRLLNETDISGLPTLGHGIDFGMGEICLEETKDNDNNDKFEFYFAVNYDKYHHQVFDNIEDAISALVEYYKKWDMIDKPNKMEKIIYQELGLKKEIFESDRCEINKFFEKYSESKELTKEELKSLYLLDIILKDADTFYNVQLGTGQNIVKNCIFKIDDDSWVVWKQTRSSYVYCPINFDNVDDACKEILDMSFVDDNIIDNFAEEAKYLLITDKQLDAFAKEHGFSFPKAKTRSKFLYIKK